MVLAIAVRILADVGVEHPGLVTLHFAEGVLELNPAALGRFDFGARQGDSGLEALQQMVVVPGLPVIAQDLDSSFHGIFCARRLMPSAALIWRLNSVFLYSTPGNAVASTVYVMGVLTGEFILSYGVMKE